MSGGERAVVTEDGTEVIPFIRKLWDVIEHPSTNNVVHWCSDTQFVVKNTKRLAKKFSTTYEKLKERLVLYKFVQDDSAVGERFDAPIGFARGDLAVLNKIRQPLSELIGSYREVAVTMDGLLKNRTCLRKDLADINDRLALCEAQSWVLESDIKILTPSK